MGIMKKTRTIIRPRHKTAACKKPPRAKSGGPLVEHLAEKKQEQRPYSVREIETVIKMRNEIACQGCADIVAAREIGRKIGRSADSVKNQIRKLIKKGKLVENPYKRGGKFTPEEVEKVAGRWEDLSSLHLTDDSKARVIAKESGKWDEDEVSGLTNQLKGIGILGENENKGDEEMECIILRREELIPQGKDDREIAEGIARELGRRPETIGVLIFRIVKHGKCRENPNNRAGDSVGRTSYGFE
jgi:hypothetical protein